jgi:hypothetical protein
VLGRRRGERKVVVLRELQRAIIYTRELSKQAIEGHVNTAFIVYLVYKGARLTERIVIVARIVTVVKIAAVLRIAIVAKIVIAVRIVIVVRKVRIAKTVE